MQVMAVNVSFTAGDSARMAISTIWSIANWRSWASVRPGPTTWARRNSRSIVGAASAGHTIAKGRPFTRK